MHNLDTNQPTARSTLARDFYDRMSQLWIIDAHEHLPAEADRVAIEVDAVSLFENYPRFNLACAGLPEDQFAAMVNRELPLDERWNIFKEYLPLIRNTSFTRVALLGMQAMYGFEDITEDNYQELSRAMQAANTPGIYQRVFRNQARILVALNQETYNEPWELPPPKSFRLPQWWESQFSIALRSDALKRIEAHLGRALLSLDAYIEGIGEVLSYYKRQGVLAVKLNKEAIELWPEKDDVAYLFDNFVRNKEQTSPARESLSPSAYKALRDFIAHAILRFAGEMGLAVCFHCGHRAEWRDYRMTNPSLMVPIFQHYRDVKFELYHAGLPWVRETGLIASAFPNVWINMCWAHALASTLARNALNEWLDMVPANKIIGFGGDTQLWVEWTLGDLIVSRQNIAAVLAGRVEEGLLKEEHAFDIARMMLYDNPKNLYQLECERLNDVEYV